MIITKSFRFRLEPDSEQRSCFAQFSGSCRYIYNYALALIIKVYQHEKRTLNYSELCKELTHLKRDKEWLNQVHSQVLQQALKDLITAFKHFFRRLENKEKPGFPKFKKKGRKDTFRYPQGIKVGNNAVFLPKIGWVRYRNSRDLEGTICQATIKREGKFWFVTIVCEMELNPPRLQLSLSNSIGIDVGLTTYATLSDGTTIENPRFLRKKEQKLKHEQRNLSRKQKGSNNYRKNAALVGELHIQVKNCRKDFQHKESTRLVKNHDVIAIETLNISGMVKNHKLAKSIADASWYQFFSMLEYKAKWAGKLLVKIPQFFPSTKACSFCKREHAMPLNIRTFECSFCGLVIDRDLNASINIRAAGHAVLNACGEISIS